jgi:hypothetical protein
MICGVTDIERPIGACCDAGGSVELGGYGWTAVTGESFDTSAREVLDGGVGRRGGSGD